VTTPWVTSDGHEFANRHGRIEIMECEHIKYLCKKHLDRDVLISLPKPHRNDSNQSSYPPCADALFLLGKSGLSGGHALEPFRQDVNYQK